jgi:hypothetical protein
MVGLLCTPTDFTSLMQVRRNFLLKTLENDYRLKRVVLAEVVASLID